MSNFIPYGRQSISEDDIKAVVDVLKSDFLTQGPFVPSFEHAVASYCNARFAIAVNSATSALHIACLALEVKPGDIVWTSPITFVASANCALYCGAVVDFVDIDSRTYNLCPIALEDKLVLAEQTGTLPKVVIPVHFSGQSCEMDKIYALSKRYGFRIIEDASHAIGGRYQGGSIGNCRYSDITVFSFHPVKIITTAEGGVALTNDEELAEKMALLRSHGITRDPKKMSRIHDCDWYYEQLELGFNYRMTELQAALGLSQMKRLDAFVTRRHQLAKRYSEVLMSLPITLPWQHPDSDSAFHLYVIRLKLDQISKTHDEVFKLLRQLGIGVNLHYIPVYMHPYYQKMGFEKGRFMKSENYYAEAISIPIFPAMNDFQQDKVIEALYGALQ